VAGAIGRGEVRLYRFPLPDKLDTRRRAHEGQRHRLFVRRHRGTPTSIIRGVPGVPSDVLLTEMDGMKTASVINLHNVVTVSKAHLGRRVRD
jgi:mRNA-degrading endonuclease toxin of MazEF toxin-antitoxin module